MMKENDILMNEVKQEIASLKAKPVDLTASIMQGIEKKQLLTSKPNRRFTLIRNSAIAVVACFAALVVLNITITYSKDYNEPAIGTLIAELYDGDFEFDYVDYAVESGLTEYTEESTEETQTIE